MRDEPIVWTAADTARAAVFLVVILFSMGSLYLACQNDEKNAEMRRECIGKGGVWFRDERICLDIKTLPLKE